MKEGYRQQLKEDIVNEPDHERRRSILESEKSSIRYSDAEKIQREYSLANRLEIQETEAEIIKAKEEIKKLKKTKDEVNSEIIDLNIKIGKIEYAMEEKQDFLDTFDPHNKKYQPHSTYNKFKNS